MAEFPIIEKVKYTNQDLKSLKSKLANDNQEYDKIIFEFPTVYVILNRAKSKTYSAYVGETNDIERRTIEHINNDVKDRPDFLELSENKSDMLIIGHDHFNKSLTLDIENRLMLYLLSSKGISKLNNRRTNNQSLYYTHDQLNPIFSEIWNNLNKINSRIFPPEDEIKVSALFKSSPFHKLTKEQYDAATKIEDKIEINLKKHNDSELGTLILVEGAAGTGKTVLLSQLFNNLNKEAIDSNSSKPKAYLLVNHNEQVSVYKNIAKKLGLDKLDINIANKPSNFITTHSNKNEKADVVLVDEAHLLWTQKVQAYRGDNHLDDLLHRAKVVVAIFDSYQMLKTTQYVEKKMIKKLEIETKSKNNFIKLNHQIRMDASPETLEWIDNFIFNHQISKIPDDDRYDLKIATDSRDLFKAIKQHNNESENNESGLSRMIATFDWDYKQKKKSDGSSWMVRAGSLSLPWNLQLPKKRGYSKLPWVEQPQTIDEIGSTFTIQGFDLNYAGLIIGPSVKYRNGKVIFDPTSSKNSRATRKRTLKSGKMEDVSQELLQNELNVLMKRGVHGLYIYAVDNELRKYLINSASFKNLLL